MLNAEPAPLSKPCQLLAAERLLPAIWQARPCLQHSAPIYLRTTDLLRGGLSLVDCCGSV